MKIKYFGSLKYIFSLTLFRLLSYLMHKTIKSRPSHLWSTLFLSLLVGRHKNPVGFFLVCSPRSLEAWQVALLATELKKLPVATAPYVVVFNCGGCNFLSHFLPQARHHHSVWKSVKKVSFHWMKWATLVIDLKIIEFSKKMCENSNETFWRIFNHCEMPFLFY